MLGICKTLIPFTLVFLITALSFHLNAKEEKFIPPVIFQHQFEASISKLAWSFDNSLLAIADGNDTVSVIEIKSGAVKAQLKNEVFVVRALAWNPIRPQLVIAGNNTQIWNYTTDGLASEFQFPSALEASKYTPEGDIDWHPDGHQLAFVFRECDGGTPARPGARVEIWDVTNSTFFQIGNCLEQGGGTAKWSPDGTKIAISAYDRVEIWNVATNTLVLEISDVADVRDLTWSPDGTKIAMGVSKGMNLSTGDVEGYNDSRIVQIRDASNGDVITEMDGHINTISSLDWNPSGDFIASGGYDNSIRLWNIAESSQQLILNIHTDLVTDVRWSPDGNMLASVGRDGRVFVWRKSDLVS